jgi:gag-polypeptide of LTR copia-type/Domain of unknown function (DUF4219)/Zinc knuckle
MSNNDNQSDEAAPATTAAAGGARVVVRGGGVPIQYPMLNDTNYGLWAVKMKIILRALGVWEAVEGEGTADTEKDQGALAAISQAVPDSTIMAITEKESAKEAWQTIKQMAVGEDRVKKARAQVLKRQFDRLVMADTTSLVEFSQVLISLVGEMRSLGLEVKEGAVVEKLFSAVPDEFLPIISTIEQWGDVTNMTVAEAVGRLRVFEEGLRGRQQTKEEGEGEKLLLTRSQWEALSLKERKNGEGIEGGASNSQERRSKKKFDKSKIKCFNCAIYGHFASECRKPKRERALLAEKEDEEEAVLMMHRLIMSGEKDNGNLKGKQNGELHFGTHQSDSHNVWYLDSVVS